MATMKKGFRHVKDHWDEETAQGMDEVERLVYRSNLLGLDWRITNTGGGNTSSKLMETDPVTGESVTVLWVKGSGGDLRTAVRGNFASLYLDKLEDLQQVYARMPERGPKTVAEDRMVGFFKHCTFNLNPRAPSIDTPLHAFVPYKHVDHTHPVACIALATAADGPSLTRQIYGDDVVWVDWQRPGFELGLVLQEVCGTHPQAKGVLLGGHGLINWADDDRLCYLLSLSLAERAADFLSRAGADSYDFGGAKYIALPEAQRTEVLTSILPWLRGRVSRTKRFVGTIETDREILDFVNAADAERLAELGTSCPDHFLRTKIKPLYVNWNPKQEDVGALKEKLDAGLVRYRQDYATYYDSHRHPDSPPMRVADPTVVLIPGLGMIAWGKSKSESRVTAEFYKAAIGVMRGAEAISKYTALDRQEAFDIEYWRLEEAKLRRMPPEQEFSRRIAAVIGAGSGIGREVSRRLIKEGATVAALDVREESALGVAEEIISQIGMGIGVAGSGVSGCGAIIGLGCDVTDRTSIAAALRTLLLAYGGLDHIVITSGLYISPDADGQVPDDAWARTYAVNATGPFLVADEAASIWKDQALQGSLVITTSVNATVPKTGSLAYDTSKAAANHLVRELAVTLAPLVRVNGLAPATMIEGSGMFSLDRVKASLAKYALPIDEDEDLATLQRHLADYYAKRTLLKQPITPHDQAEAILLLVGDRLSKTSGQVLTVDGGLTEAFLR